MLDEVQSVFEEFKQEMFKKFSERLNKEDNTAAPWNFDIDTLEKRFSDEVLEFQESYSYYYYASSKEEEERAKREMLEEIIDVANFCLFLWAKLKKEADA